MASDTEESRPDQGGAVGYGRPPEQHRFRPGEPSRNPHGRRGKPRSAEHAQASEPDFLDELVTVSIDTRRQQVTREESIDHALYMKAVKGDVRAARELSSRRSLREKRRAMAARSAAAEADAPVSAEDEALIASALRRAGRLGGVNGSGADQVSDAEAGDE